MNVTRATVLASFRSSAEAEAARRHLEELGVPAGQVDVAARGVRPVEVVTDPRSYALATAEGAIVGGVLGLVAGLLAALLPVGALVPALAAALGGLAGVVAGAALGAFAHAAVGWRAELVLRSTFDADGYDLVAAPRWTWSAPPACSGPTRSSAWSRPRPRPRRRDDPRWPDGSPDDGGRARPPVLSWRGWWGGRVRGRRRRGRQGRAAPRPRRRRARPGCGRWGGGRRRGG